jgi:hypothetical protein
MSIPSLIIVLFIFFLTTVIIIRPFLEESGDVGFSPDLRDSLEGERERLLSALMDLDLSHDLGKIPTEEYQSQREVLLRQAADVLRRIDQGSESRKNSV